MDLKEWVIDRRLALARLENVMISISKQDNKGNTFTGAVMTAFNVKRQRGVEIDPSLQYGRCGTISVHGKSYDWFDKGDKYEFLASE